MIVLIIIGWLICGVVGSVWGSYLCRTHIGVFFLFMALLGPVNLMTAVIVFIISFLENKNFKIKTQWGNYD